MLLIFIILHVYDSYKSPGKVFTLTVFGALVYFRKAGNKYDFRKNIHYYPSTWIYSEVYHQDSMSDFEREWWQQEFSFFRNCPAT